MWGVDGREEPGDKQCNRGSGSGSWLLGAADRGVDLAWLLTSLSFIPAVPRPPPPSPVLPFIHVLSWGEVHPPRQYSTHKILPDLAVSVLQFDQPAKPELLPKCQARPSGSQFSLQRARLTSSLLDVLRCSSPLGNQGQTTASMFPGENLNRQSSLRDADFKDPEKEREREIQARVVSKASLEILRAWEPCVNITSLGIFPDLPLPTERLCLLIAYLSDKCPLHEGRDSGLEVVQKITLERN